MYKKVISIVFVFFLLMGAGIALPGCLDGANNSSEKGKIQTADNKTAFKDSSGQTQLKDDKKPEESYVPAPAEEKSKVNEEKSLTDDKTQNESPNSQPNVVNKKDSGNSINNNPVTTTGNNNNNNNQSVSRGAGVVDKSKYPLLSKVNGSFGQFHYRDLAGGRIEVDPQWVAENIVTITLPGLERQVQVHKDAADHFILAFNYIKNGTAVVNGQEVPLLSLIYSMDGIYVPRHVNWNSAKGLSNHSWGTAIDINASGHFGYVDPQKSPNDPNLILWEKAFKPAGFSWGNRYNDSMHYELIK